MSWEDEPQLAEGRTVHLHVDQPSVKYSRNAKGDTQVEVKASAGATPELMDEIRRAAFQTYKAAVEQTGGKLPEVPEP